MLIWGQLIKMKKLIMYIYPNGQRLNNKGNPSYFINVLKQCLESDIVSSSLPSWIDLIFGYKQSGKEALLANNLFHPQAYENINKSQNANLKASAKYFLSKEFGIIPDKLFNDPHPQK